MAAVSRRLAFAFPFGCLTALTAHIVSFGDDHAFGGEANEAIVATAIGGSVAVALGILHAFLTAGSTTVTGTIARARVAAMLPSPGSVFGIAAAVYYAIESLEGNGIELGWPTLILGALATTVAVALQALCAQFGRFVDTLVRELVARLGARPTLATSMAPQPHPLRAQRLLIARRLGRAPPHERRFSSY